MTIEITLDGATRLADSTDRAAWHAARAAGPTASEVHRIAKGGIPTWKKIDKEKADPGTWKGNRHTARGNEREASLLANVGDLLDGRTIVPNQAVWAAGFMPEFMATPDGFVLDAAGKVVAGAEVKSHDHGWKRKSIPPEHLAQCVWGMVVTGLDEWVYAWEVYGPDGMPDLDADPVIIVIRHIDHWQLAEHLAARAREFVQWRADGADSDEPSVDDDLDVLLDEWREARAAAEQAAADEKAIAARIKKHAIEQPGARENGVRLTGSTAGALLVVQNRVAIDEKAWKAAEPQGFAEWDAARKAVDETAETAKALYRRVTAVPTLRHFDPAEAKEKKA